MELVSVYKTDNHETCSKCNEMGLDRIYANQDRKLSQTEARAQNRGLSVGNKCVVLSTVCFGLTCIFLVAAIVVLLIKLTAEREVQATQMSQSISRDQTEKDQLQNSFNSLSQKNLELETRVKYLTAEKKQLQSDFNSSSQKKLELETRVIDLTAEKSQLKTVVKDLTAEKSRLETRVNDLTAEKNQLQSNFNSLSQKKLELETRVNDLTAEKSQLQRNFNSSSQKKLELETRVKDLTAEKSQLQRNFNSSSQKKLELETRANDLTAEKSRLETRIKDLTAEKSQLQSNFNSLSQKKLELETRANHLTAEKSRLETRVNDLTAEKSQLQSNFNSLSQKKLELETRVKDLTAEKSQLQNSLNSLNQKKLKLETELTKSSEQATGCLFMSNEEKSWSDSRQYCRDHGGDLVILNTEQKQRCVSSFVKERVWIGLSDREEEGNMKWVDNSPLKQGFWFRDEPNDSDGNEDCIEIIPGNFILNNWNDLPCSLNRKGICETSKFHP